MDEIRKEIEAVNQEFAACVRKGDFKSLANLYTKDACLFAPNSIEVCGREAIGSYWDKAFTQLGVDNAHLKTLDLLGQGDLVVERGEFWMTTIGIQEGILDAGKYVVVWKKTNEGWKLHWDIWNTSLANP